MPLPYADHDLVVHDDSDSSSSSSSSSSSDSSSTFDEDLTDWGFLVNTFGELASTAAQDSLLPPLSSPLNLTWPIQSIPENPLSPVLSTGRRAKAVHSDGLLQQSNSGTQLEPEAELGPQVISTLVDRSHEVAHDALLGEQGSTILDSGLADVEMTPRTSQAIMVENSHDESLASVVPMDERRAGPCQNLSDLFWVSMSPMDEAEARRVPTAALVGETCCPNTPKSRFGQELQKWIGASSTLESLAPAVLQMKEQDTPEESTKRLLAWLEASHSKVHKCRRARRANDAVSREICCLSASKEPFGRELQECFGAASALKSLVPSAQGTDDKQNISDVATWRLLPCYDASQSKAYEVDEEIRSWATTRVPSVPSLSGSSLADMLPWDNAEAGPVPNHALAGEHFGQELQERLGLVTPREDTVRKWTQPLIAWLDANHGKVRVMMKRRKARQAQHLQLQQPFEHSL